MEPKPNTHRHLQLVAPNGVVIPFPLERRKRDAEQQAKERGLARLVELVFGPESAA